MYKIDVNKYTIIWLPITSYNKEWSIEHQKSVESYSLKKKKKTLIKDCDINESNSL